MKKFTAWYRRISRYSTLVLLVITVALGSYVWLNRTQVYYQTYCSEPDDLEYGRLYSNSYDCDTAVIDYIKQSGGQCLKAGCKRVEQ